MGKWYLNKHTILKTITYRILGIIGTYLIAWIITRNVTISTYITIGETIFKMIGYYAHEIGWEWIKRKKDEKRPSLCNN